MTSNAQTLTVIACATIICIDGNMADWTALTTTPSYADNPTDAGGGSGDITAIRITSGNGNLYVRWDETLTSNKNHDRERRLLDHGGREPGRHAGRPRLGHVRLLGRTDRPGGAAVRHLHDRWQRPAEL